MIFTRAIRGGGELGSKMASETSHIWVLSSGFVTAFHCVRKDWQLCVWTLSTRRVDQTCWLGSYSRERGMQPALMRHKQMKRLAGKSDSPCVKLMWTCGAIKKKKKGGVEEKSRWRQWYNSIKYTILQTFKWSVLRTKNQYCWLLYS